MSLLHLVRAQRTSPRPSRLGLLLTAVALVLALPSLPAAAQQEPYSNASDTISTSNASWMRWLADSTNLATLSLPGTNDSMSNETSSTPYTVSIRQLNQRVELRPQLDAGIRALSVRLRLEGTALKIYLLEVYPMGTLEEVLSAAEGFVVANPSETVLLRIGREYPEDTNPAFAAAVQSTLNNHASSILCDGNGLPSLGRARGKIVILNDFGGTCGVPWNSFTSHEQWWTATANEKWDMVRAHLNTANAGSPTTMYVTNLSAEAGFEFGPLYGDYAQTINTNTLSHLNSANIKRAGVVLMDFPGSGLINALIDRNFRQNVFSVPVGTSRLAVGAFLEPGFDRPGMDYGYKDFTAALARPESCREACLAEYPKCTAFSYNKTQARCWLKTGLPTPGASTNAVAGVLTRLSTPSPQTVGTTLEMGIDRPGMDYTWFDLPEARPELCRVACFNDSARCKSFTYAKPGTTSGARARCYLKSGIPAPGLNANTDSGTTQTSATMGYFSGSVELNIDRPGMEYSSFELAEARPELCREACRNEPAACKSFSYTRPGGSNSKPKCSLKLGIPDPVSSPWSDSGINSNQ